MEKLEDLMEYMGLSAFDFEDEPPFEEEPDEVIEYGPFKKAE